MLSRCSRQSTTMHAEGEVELADTPILLLAWEHSYYMTEKLGGANCLGHPHALWAVTSHSSRCKH